MSHVIDPTLSPDALDAFRKLVLRFECEDCGKVSVRTSLTPSVCPYCGHKDER